MSASAATLVDGAGIAPDVDRTVAVTDDGMQEGENTGSAIVAGPGGDASAALSVPTLGVAGNDPTASPAGSTAAPDDRAEGVVQVR